MRANACSGSSVACTTLLISLNKESRAFRSRNSDNSSLTGIVVNSKDVSDALTDALGEDKTNESEDSIGSPRRQPRRDASAGAEGQGYLREHKIRETDHDAARHAHRHIPSSGRRSKRQRDQDDDQTRPRPRPAPVQLGLQHR